MRRTAHCLPLALLFLASALPSNAQKEASAETSVTVRAGAPLKVECALRPEQRVEWRLDGGELPGDLRPSGEVSAGDGRLVATVRAAAARPHHAGLYTCSRDRRQAVRVAVDSATSSAHPPPSAPPPQHSAPPGSGETSVTSDDEAPIVLYDVKGNITLTCTVAGDNNDPIVWKKNGTVIDAISDLKDRYKLDGNTFNISRRAHEDDYGNYSCAAAGAEQQWRVHARPVAKLPANANVVEGQKLKLVCKVIGKPYPRVRWTFSNTSEEVANSTDVLTVLGERAVLQRNEQGVEDAELIVEAADRIDAGRYWCHAGDDAAPAVLRVKDMYAALWPFLGICAEVFILCAVILVYEKRRTKPELDDSDTDNHDQKKS